MSAKEERIINDLVSTIKSSDERTTKPYDTSAIVRRVDTEKGIAYVHIPGGIDETPVKLTINAKDGDEVQVRVANGSAFLLGNASAPPTDDSTAKRAETDALRANKAANNAESSAKVAAEAASKAVADVTELEGNVSALNTRVTNAEGDITTVEGNITNLQGRVTDAEEDIDDTLAGLALAQNVIGTLQWITAHSTVTTDTTPQQGTTYYIKNQDNTFTVVTDTTGKNPAQEGWYVMDESVQNYIASHVALTNDGLVVTKDATKWKVLIKDDGVYIIDNTNGLNEVVAKYKDVIQLGKDTSERLEINTNGLTAFNSDSVPFFDVDYNGGQTTETQKVSLKQNSSLLFFPYCNSRVSVQSDTISNQQLVYVNENLVDYQGYTLKQIQASINNASIVLDYPSAFVMGLNNIDTRLSTNCSITGRLHYLFITPNIPDIVIGESDDINITSDIILYSRTTAKWFVAQLKFRYHDDTLDGQRVIGIKEYLLLPNEEDYTVGDGEINSKVLLQLEKSITTTAPAFTFGTNGSDISGSWSARMGQGLISENDNQISIGRFNENKSTNLFEVGNGTSDSARNNAFEVADSGDILSSGDIEDGTGNVLSDKADASSLATVATSGSYNDLSNKPSLATVATTGSYNDLTNKPSLPEIDKGRTGSISCNANNYKDATVTFDTEFSAVPKVVVSIYSTSTAGAIGSLTCSALDVTTTGFKVRVFNAGSASRSPAVDWIAIN